MAGRPWSGCACRCGPTTGAEAAVVQTTNVCLSTACCKMVRQFAYNKEWHSSSNGAAARRTQYRHHTYHCCMHRADANCLCTARMLHGAPTQAPQTHLQLHREAPGRHRGAEGPAEPRHQHVVAVWGSRHPAVAETQCKHSLMLHLLMQLTYTTSLILSNLHAKRGFKTHPFSNDVFGLLQHHDLQLL